MRETPVLLQWGIRLGPSCDGDGMIKSPKGVLSPTAVIETVLLPITRSPKSLDGIIAALSHPIESNVLVFSSFALYNV